MRLHIIIDLPRGERGLRGSRPPRHRRAHPLDVAREGTVAREGAMERGMMRARGVWMVEVDVDLI